MNTLYEIEYLFMNELGERSSYGWRTSNIVVYDTSTVLGTTLQHAFDCANEDGDMSGVDKVLARHFGVVDDEVAFYFDRNGIEDESMWLEVQADFNIVINKYTKVKEEK